VAAVALASAADRHSDGAVL